MFPPMSVDEFAEERKELTTEAIRYAHLIDQELKATLPQIAPERLTATCQSRPRERGRWVARQLIENDKTLERLAALVKSTTMSGSS